MIRMSLLISAIVLMASAVSAQTHPCDLVAPTSGTAVAGQTRTLSVCHSGLDTNGNAIDGTKVYDNGVGSAITLTKSATANAAGFYEFTAPYVVPSVAGVHTLAATFISGTFESPTSSPFVLTVSLPRTAPVAGTKTQVR